MEYRDSSRRSVRLDDVIGRGGEATIYKVANRPGLLAKIYENQPRGEYARKLLWMRDHPPNDPTASQQHASLAWPLDLLFASNGQLAGYLMPHIEKAVTLLDVFNPRQRTLILPEFNRRYLHRAARNLAAAMGALHARGYVVGDINESNILVTPRALVTMIDTDSFQVREPARSGAIVYTCPVARQEYTPPELQGKALKNTERSPEQDAFGLGVIIYQMLMEGNHPFRAQWLGQGEPPPIEERIRRGCFPYRNPPICPVAPPPRTPSLDNLHPIVAGLVLRCFIEGHRSPQNRPTPEQWEQAISEAEAALTLCRNGHYYSNHLSDCPVCNPRSPGQQIPLPAIPSRYTARKPRPDRLDLSKLPQRPQTGLQSRTSKPPTPPTRTIIPPVSLPPVSLKTSRLPRLRLPVRKPLTSAYPAKVPIRRAVPLSRQSLLSSFGMGALLGAVAGALGTALIATLAWSMANALRWEILWGLGAAVAAAWRSWQIGQGISFTVSRSIGWGAVLQYGVAGILAAFGAFVGLLISSSILALALGGLMGGLGGWLLGDALWNRLPLVRWDLVGAAVIVLLFAWLAYLGAEWLGRTWPGEISGRAITSLAAWTAGRGMGWLWISALVGAVGGILGGSLAGGLSEVLAELIGFRH
jgi:serine/threonine protein kinase